MKVPQVFSRALGMGLTVLLASALPVPTEAQQARVDAETARRMIAATARPDGWWTVSNAEYRARNDALPDFYAMRLEVGPSGLTSVGCMWGGRDEEMLGPFWTLVNAWDPVEGALLAYQVSPAGAVAIGHARPTGGADHEEEAIQRFAAPGYEPGQEPGRFRHLTTLPHPDTLVTRSFDWSDGEWTPRRHDTWVWTPAEDREPPVC